MGVRAFARMHASQKFEEGVSEGVDVAVVSSLLFGAFTPLGDSRRSSAVLTQMFRR